ncbi:MAG: hypothetical protein BTN85_1198 [Candidatus Methanohalarchaeum thermophilum]|uniref:Uncharacterized protein n=1 Tax=Methanohalarchaeum thermophilum TaxID=1903181 RepID=A0A1Q6DWF9_METT1|nr:MAG: hypothetical protein BTN85_1198 [Candidatus Methanohalarchaeum thermophilum]
MVNKEMISRPLKEIIREIAIAVAEGQESLDRRSIETQKEIDRAIREGEIDHDLDAAWLRFSDVDVDLNVAFSLEGKKEIDRKGKGRSLYRLRIGAAPINPSITETTEYDLEASSKVKFNIVPVPPERIVNE